MSSPSTSEETRRSQSMVDSAIRIAFIGLIAVWCFLIFKPFVALVAWSAIIAVTAYPLFKRLTRLLGGRRKLAAALFAVLALSIVVLPSIALVGSLSKTGRSAMASLENKVTHIEPPNASVKEWPLIGDQVYTIWSGAATNLERTIEQYHDEVKSALGWFFRSLASVGLDVLLTILAFIISIPMMLYAEEANRASIAFFGRITDQNGQEYSNASRDTIRSVVKGVVLVAVIQAFLGWIGFWFADLPAPGVWAVILLIMAIVQLPALILFIPLIIYVFSYASSGVAIAFAVWGVVVSISDGFLKPLFLGRGLKTPMLVILIGAIGGMMFHGIVGLFIGAVVMALGYQFYTSWLRHWELDAEVESGS